MFLTINRSECEKAEVFRGFCSRPRCRHTHLVSPAELTGKDDDANSQIKHFEVMLGF